MAAVFPPPAIADFDATAYYRVTRTGSATTMRALGIEPGDVVMHCQSGGDQFLMTAGKRTRITTADVGATLATLTGAGVLAALEDAE